MGKDSKSYFKAWKKSKSEWTPAEPSKLVLTYISKERLYLF